MLPKTLPSCFLTNLETNIKVTQERLSGPRVALSTCRRSHDYCHDHLDLERLPKMARVKPPLSPSA